MKDILMAVSSRSFRADVRVLQNVLQLIGKPGAKRIRRRFDIGANEYLIACQTDQDRVRFELVTEKVDICIWLVDNMVEVLTYKDYTKSVEESFRAGDSAVEFVKEHVAHIRRILTINTPEGLFKEDVERVRDWVQNNSSGTTGRCTKVVETKSHRLRVWTTTKGGCMIETFKGDNELFVNLTAKDFTCSFEHRRDYVGKWTIAERNKELVAARKFLHRVFPSAFAERSIRA